MAVFAYQGTGERGERRSGEVDAPSRSEALRRLAMDRIQPLTLVAKADASPSKARDEAPSGKARRETSPTGGIRLSTPQLILFTDELADFLNSGLQLEPALHLMENRDEHSPVKTVAAFLREKVRDGMSFSEALRIASPSFDDLYCNLVAAGEVSGALAPMLRRQATHLVAMQDLRSRVKLALIYPAALVLAGAVAMTVFMTVLVPQMIKLFSKTGSTMPLPTYILVQISNMTHRYGLFTAAVIGIAAAGFVAAIRQPAGRRWWDQNKLRVSLIGPLLSATFYAQFCQTMANLLQNGLPLLTALKLMSRATGNVFYRSLLIRITDLVGEGASLTRAMKAVGHFPANLRDLVKVGEQTGELGSTLEKIGQRFDKVIQMRIDRIMSIVPLIIIAALGLMVLLIAWSMLSGIFQVMNGLQGHGRH
ncbi:MAG TPA: type II secretion system F family protein [Candidatus Methylacidiphilales bacterium]|jgi:type II secretory pathway component PulF|nr:type II secretion system F family protein [Candidatus Methylacidiphilales bacterium]